MLYVTIALLSLLTYAVRYYCTVISADVCCTLLLYCYLCWSMLYITSALLSLLAYAVRYHCIVISADVCCTLLLHCYLAAAAGTVKSCRCRRYQNMSTETPKTPRQKHKFITRKRAIFGVGFVRYCRWNISRYCLGLHGVPSFGEAAKGYSSVLRLVPAVSKHDMQVFCVHRRLIVVHRRDC